MKFFKQRPQLLFAFLLAAIGIAAGLVFQSYKIELDLNIGQAQSQTSPHWPHIRTMKTDFRIHYQLEPNKTQEYDFAASHYDAIMGGSRNEHKSRNPGIKWMPYSVLWGPIIGGNDEKAIQSACGNSGFVTSGGTPVTFFIWTTTRKAINPNNSCTVNYLKNRYAELASGADGVFIDEYTPAGFSMVTHPNDQFTSAGAYGDAVSNMLPGLRTAMGGKPLMLNAASYANDTIFGWYQKAGWAHLEQLQHMNAGTGLAGAWQFVDRLLAAGIIVDNVHTYATYSGVDQNRNKMWALASHYMTLPAGNPDLSYFHLQDGWGHTFESEWFGAVEVDVGAPAAPRFQFHSATNVWGREYTKARVLIRLGTSYSSCQSYDLGGTFFRLNADGIVGGATTSVSLCQGEGAILMRSSDLPSDTVAPSIPANLTTSVQSSSQINLSWSASTDNIGVTSYRIERCQGSSCSNFTQIVSPSGTSHNDTNLSASTLYRYRVRAADAAGNLSGYSSIAEATTQQTPTAQPACTNPSPLPSGFAAPCPALSLSATSVSKTGSVIVTATPPTSLASYQYKTIYVSDSAWACSGKAGGFWCPLTLGGTSDSQAPAYVTKNTAGTLNLTSSILSNLSSGTHYVLSWDWAWDQNSNCYKGPGLNTCNTGAWRVQTLNVQ